MVEIPPPYDIRRKNMTRHMGPYASNVYLAYIALLEAAVRHKGGTLDDLYDLQDRAFADAENHMEGED
jgi:hypothetical protein